MAEANETNSGACALVHGDIKIIESKNYNKIGLNDKYHELGVNIGRDGDILLNDGAPILTIAKILGIKEIAAEIRVIHKEWAKFKEEIDIFAKKYFNGELYSPCLHPDLREIKSRYGDERFK